MTFPDPLNNPDAERSVLGAAIVDAAFRADALAELDAACFDHAERRAVFLALDDDTTEARVVQCLVDGVTIGGKRFTLGKGNARALVATLIGDAGTPDGERPNIPLLRQLEARRHQEHLGERLALGAYNGFDLDKLAAIGEEIRLMAQSLVRETISQDGEVAMEFDAFLDEPAPEYDWTIPHVMERANRFVLTGREGVGKSTLLRQLAVQCACGIHPFGEADFEPLRVLLIDLENPRPEVKRRLRALRAKIGNRYVAGRLHVWHQPQGIDLNDDHDRALLRARMDEVTPDLVIAGPFYKMFSGDPDRESDTKPVAAFLDRVRVDYDCALMVEMHMPHEGHGGRPFGWSGWRRWPEFGYELTEGGLLRPWRPARNADVRIPGALQRGGEWPFSVASRSRDVLWARIVDLVEKSPERPSVRTLAQDLGVGKSSVQRVIDEHSSEWEGMDE